MGSQRITDPKTRTLRHGAVCAVDSGNRARPVLGGYGTSHHPRRGILRNLAWRSSSSGAKSYLPLCRIRSVLLLTTRLGSRLTFRA